MEWLLGVTAYGGRLSISQCCEELRQLTYM